MKPIPMGLLAVIFALVGSNLLASSLVGLGDGEALYYCYGRHPSLSYLDHPPLIGWLLYGSTTWFGPSVFSVRLVSMAMTVLTVLCTYQLARDLFGPKGAMWSVLVLGATPVFSVGMIAATPDAPLAALVSLFTWQLYRAYVDDGTSLWSRLGRPAMLGGVVGLAFLSKYTGVGLMLTSLLVTATPRNRKWLRRPGYWIGVLLAAMGSLPVIIWNVEHGFASVLHRLVWTQDTAGFSVRNLGALIGGQLVYVGPLMLILLVLGSRWVWKQPRCEGGKRVLLLTSLPTLGLTYLLTLWSDVAEPHWPAVGYVPLFVAAGGWIAQAGRRVVRFARIAVIMGWMALGVLHVAVLTPLLPMVTPRETYEPKYDLGNELLGWSEVAAMIRDANPDRHDVAAPFYTQCSQLFFALRERDDPNVRCVSRGTDDFDFWYPDFVPQTRPIWFVTDNRFSYDLNQLLPEMEPVGSPLVVQIRRAGIVVRRFEILALQPTMRVP